ncbi:hypothetical protein XENOCAPTIV_025668 [Xenoophorus captivus]|uniref:Uncharacterized protein n=1 Tax=Xenoophorus captivus TaxID=1517983 RepID=A0ABV0S8T5_9TELE
METWISVMDALAYFHCCLNPILYAFLGVKFNQTPRSTLAIIIRGRGGWSQKKAPLTNNRGQISSSLCRVRCRLHPSEAKKDRVRQTPTMKGADGFLKLPAYTGSEETVFSPDSSGSSDILGPYYPPSHYVFYCTSSLSSSSGALSPSKFLKLSTSHEETEEEGKIVVDSNKGQGWDEVNAEASCNSQLTQASQERDAVDGWMSSVLISTVKTRLLRLLNMTWTPMP